MGVSHILKNKSPLNFIKSKLVDSKASKTMIHIHQGMGIERFKSEESEERFKSSKQVVMLWKIASNKYWYAIFESSKVCEGQIKGSDILMAT